MAQAWGFVGHFSHVGIPSGIPAKATGWKWEGPKVAVRHKCTLVEYFYYAGKADGQGS